MKDLILKCIASKKKLHLKIMDGPIATTDKRKEMEQSPLPKDNSAILCRELLLLYLHFHDSSENIS